MVKKISALNLDDLEMDTIEYKTIHDFIKRENYIEYLYDICFRNEELFQQYIITYKNNTLTSDLNKEDMEMLFAIKSVKEIYNNYKEIETLKNE